MRYLKINSKGQWLVEIHGEKVLLPSKPEEIEYFGSDRNHEQEFNIIQHGSWLIINGWQVYFTGEAYFYFKYWTLDGNNVEFSEELNDRFILRWHFKNQS